MNTLSPFPHTRMWSVAGSLAADCFAQILSMVWALHFKHQHMLLWANLLSHRLPIAAEEDQLLAVSFEILSEVSECADSSQKIFVTIKTGESWLIIKWATQLWTTYRGCLCLDKCQRVWILIWLIAHWLITCQIHHCLHSLLLTPYSISYSNSCYWVNFSMANLLLIKLSLTVHSIPIANVSVMGAFEVGLCALSFPQTPCPERLLIHICSCRFEVTHMLVIHATTISSVHSTA